MKEPKKPNDEDCCNSGCNPCVFDVYNKQLALYETFLESGGVGVNDRENSISPLQYTPFLVIENMELCELHRLIFFKRNSVENHKLWWKPGDYFLLKFMLENEQITRAYTPLKRGLDIDIEYDFATIVKIYENGIVSKYMYNLKKGEQTFWRGPYGMYDLLPNQFDRIIMIAQGTGIAPYISIISHILNDENNFTKIMLFYCCQTIDKILFRNQLYAFNSFWNFSYEIYLSGNILLDYAIKYQEPLKYQRLNLHDFEKLKPITTKDQFLICGSKVFMDYFKSLLHSHFQNENLVLF